MKNEELLIAAGWNVLTVWECETWDETILLTALQKVFGLVHSIKSYRNMLGVR